jgi:hypothetical protein
VTRTPLQENGTSRTVSRWIRVASGFLERFSDLDLAPDKLMAAAAKNVGSENWGEGSFRSGLKALCLGVNRDENLSALGRYSLKRITRLRLEDRLKIEGFLKRYPAVLEEKVVAPILITGQPRSGTTVLQRLLAIDPQFRTARTYELLNPIPDKAAPNQQDRRIQRTEWDLRIFGWISPGIYEAHPMSAESPEECYLLLERVFNQPVACIFLDIPQYQDWLFSRQLPDLISDYHYYKKQVQLLQWNRSARRWLLKAPAHALFLEAYLTVFPDVRVIVTHRDPVKAVPSLCSLSMRVRSSLYFEDDLEKMGNRLLGLSIAGRKRILEARLRLKEEQFYDCKYEEFIGNPIGMVRRIYKFVQAELSPKVESEMQQYLESSKRGIHNRHEYCLGDFGLNAEQILEGFYQ